jgi:hypothetical protein
MPRKHYKPEEVVAKLRQVDVWVSQRRSVADAIRSISVTEAVMEHVFSLYGTREFRDAGGKFRPCRAGNIGGNKKCEPVFACSTVFHVPRELNLKTLESISFPTSSQKADITVCRRHPMLVRLSSTIALCTTMWMGRNGRSATTSGTGSRLSTKPRRRLSG